MDEQQRSQHERTNPQPLPHLQLEIPGLPAPQHSVSNTQALLEASKEFVAQGNSAEEKVALQIILISSAVLALVGGLGISNQNNVSFTVGVGMLLIIAVIGLGLSLVAGVVHFMLERKFWYDGWRKGADALKIIQTMSNPTEKENAALIAISSTPQGSNRTAFWLQIISFLIGVMSLLIIIVIGIISKIS